MIKLTAGKHYKDRDGKVIGPLFEDDFGQFTAKDQHHSNVSWYRNGRRFKTEEFSWDLVEEFVPPRETEEFFVKIFNDPETEARLTEGYTYIPELFAIDDEVLNVKTNSEWKIIKCKLVFEGSDDWKLIEKS